MTGALTETYFYLYSHSSFRGALYEIQRRSITRKLPLAVNVFPEAPTAWPILVETETPSELPVRTASYERGLLFLAKSLSRGAGAGGAAVDKQSTVDRQKYGASR